VRNVPNEARRRLFDGSCRGGCHDHPSDFRKCLASMGTLSQLSLWLVCSYNRRIPLLLPSVDVVGFECRRKERLRLHTWYTALVGQAQEWEQSRALTIIGKFSDKSGGWHINYMDLYRQQWF
jgi:hypothetical protein